MPRLYRECVQCQHDFYISDKDQEFFASRELELPKRCWTCRKQNRDEANQQKQEQAEQAANTGVTEVFVPDERPRRPGGKS